MGWGGSDSNGRGDIGTGGNQKGLGTRVRKDGGSWRGMCGVGAPPDEPTGTPASGLGVLTFLSVSCPHSWNSVEMFAASIRFDDKVKLSGPRANLHPLLWLGAASSRIRIGGYFAESNHRILESRCWAF